MIVLYAKISLFVRVFVFLGALTRLLFFFVLRGGFGAVVPSAAERLRLRPPPRRIFRTIFCADSPRRVASILRALTSAD
jgi:hypothetical protein